MTEADKKYFTPERIRKMQQYILDHPIDHRYDELAELSIYDGDDVPPDQLASRGYYELLKDFGMLPPGIE